MCKFLLVFVVSILPISSGVWEAHAQEKAQISVCHAIANNHHQTLPVLKAGFKSVAVGENEVQISYAGHSTFRIESNKGVVVATDYDGGFVSGTLPTIVTMNHAHDTHYTDTPDVNIKHVLRGWGTNGKAAQHDLVEQDVYVRNIPTDLYSYGTLIEENGNSIFVFEVAGLCIGHLGHLHHPLTPQHIAEIGRLDIMFAPVDGLYTLSQAGIIEIAKQVRASLLIPMHYFSGFSLGEFLEEMRKDFAVEYSEEKKLKVSLNTLPSQPTVMVLPLDY